MLSENRHREEKRNSKPPTIPDLNCRFRASPRCLCTVSAGRLSRVTAGCSSSLVHDVVRDESIEERQQERKSSLNHYSFIPNGFLLFFSFIGSFCLLPSPLTSCCSLLTWLDGLLNTMLLRFITLLEKCIVDVYNIKAVFPFCLLWCCVLSS